ncbi:hypothetical protein CNY67_05075 [Desulfovibrio sp. G11]|nr:hypothetical protein CNY67_05075 [Desulfovibrio sp. G11]
MRTGGTGVFSLVPALVAPCADFVSALMFFDSRVLLLPSERFWASGLAKNDALLAYYRQGGEMP